VTYKRKVEKNEMKRENENERGLVTYFFLQLLIMKRIDQIEKKIKSVCVEGEIERERNREGKKERESV
jgi:hypothetical protein